MVLTFLVQLRVAPVEVTLRKSISKPSICGVWWFQPEIFPLHLNSVVVCIRYLPKFAKNNNSPKNKALEYACGSPKPCVVEQPNHTKPLILVVSK